MFLGFADNILQEVVCVYVVISTTEGMSIYGV